MAKSVVILRGTSNAGKTSVAELITTGRVDAVIVSADDFFYKNGHYNFDANLLGAAHGQCKAKFMQAIARGEELIVVSNTNTKESEFGYYKTLAEQQGYLVFFLVIEKRHDQVNSHNCPASSIEKQAAAIKSSLTLK